ncbi:MAG: EcsC family protein [Planctomycetia bacterium]|nr:EcsC family protein [Planctomycetia bacterium]
MTSPLNETEMVFLHEAAKFFESPSLLMRIADMTGKPLELITSQLKGLPGPGSQLVQKAFGALCKVSCQSVQVSPKRMTFTEACRESGDGAFFHRVGTGITGAAGGFFGFAGLGVELPVTTGIMFRSIANIASNFGEDLTKEEVRLNCMSVFSYGGTNASGTTSQLDSTYYTARVLMTQMINKTAQAVAGKSAAAIAMMVERESCPVLVRLLMTIAQRFGIVISEKLVLQSLPLFGALSGATINYAFTGYFNDVAKYHFGIRYLDRKYDIETVQAVYQNYQKK